MNIKIFFGSRSQGRILGALSLKRRYFNPLGNVDFMEVILFGLAQSAFFSKQS